MRIRVDLAIAAAAAAMLMVFTAVPIVHAETVGVDAHPVVAVPGSAIEVSGSGFVPFEGVDLFLDGVNADVVTAHRDGSFDGRVRLPDEAVPGRHWISARGRRHGDVTHVAVQVRPSATVGWPQPAYDAARTGAAPQDPWITARNVASLQAGVRRNVSQQEPIVVGDLLVGSVGGYEGRAAVVASDVWTGEERWRVEIDGQGRIASDGDVVVVAGWHGVRAVDAVTGAPRWTREMPPWVDEITTGVTIADERAFLVGQSWSRTGTARIFAYDVGSGSVAWEASVPGYAGGWSQSVAVSDDAVFVSVSERRGGIASFDAETGDLHWRTDLRFQERPGPITVFGDLVLTHAEWQGNVVALDAGTGRVRWRTPAVGGSGGSDSLTISQGRVIVGSTWWESGGGELAAIDPDTGAVAWRRSLRSGISGSSAAGSLLAVMTNEGEFWAVDPETGARRWGTLVTSNPSGRPVIADGAIHVASWNGTVTTLRLPTPPKPRPEGLVPDPTAVLDGAHEIDAVSQGWTVLGEDGLGDARNADVTSAISFGGDVFVGTRAAPASTGADIWRGRDGEPFERAAVFGGAGSVELAVFDGALYAITVGAGGIDLYRSQDGTGFELVTGGPTDGTDATLLPGGESLAILARTDDGVVATVLDEDGRIERADVPSTQARGLRPIADRLAPWTDGVGFDGMRYVGLAAASGGELWRTTDGTTFERVEGIEAFLPTGATPVPQVVADGHLYVVIESGDGLRIVRTDDGSAFERVPTEVGRVPDRHVNGDLVAIDEGLVLATGNRDQRVLDGEAPLEVARARAFSVQIALGEGAFAPIPDVPADPHDARSQLVGSDGTLLLAVSNFREGDALMRSTDGRTWETILREDGSTPFTTDARLAVIDGYAYLFLTDQELGVTVWRYDTPVASIGDGGVAAWVWLTIGIVAAIGLAGAGWLLVRRHRPGPPTVGPTEPWAPGVPSHERLHV